MSIKFKLFQAGMICFGLAGAAEVSAGAAAGPTSIPCSQIGAKAGAGYQGDGLAVLPTDDGARLRCVFQRLEGEATCDGLWLTSTVTNEVRERFRVVATRVGTRSTASPNDQENDTRWNAPLPPTGTVTIDGQAVRFTRPGVVEEYSVSMDGVRQDFVVLERPKGAGELTVRLAVSGARIEPTAGGAQLVLESCGRRIAYGRLRVTDAMSKELPGRMEMVDVERESVLDCGSPLPLSVGAGSLESSRGLPQSKTGRNTAQLAVVVNDAGAVYPVRIDPTFSDANWISMGGIPGANNQVNAAVVDGSGNLYIGGNFTLAGNAFANRIAKWNGSSWSALGSGMGDANSFVFALAVSGSNVYAGGGFTTAGGGAATNIAKWDGSRWSALSSGMNDTVSALVVSAGDLYAGGYFTNAGGSAANGIAKWNGSSWSALGSGMGGASYPNLYPSVTALAVSGSSVYAAGNFTTAGSTSANYIAKWDGNSWSALASGITGPQPYYVPIVLALAVSGNDLYAGGNFIMAGSTAATNIAKWDGTSWSALGSGMNNIVSALAVSGSGLYVGGAFTTAGGTPANSIAKWDGSSWSALGSGMSGGLFVSALALSGSNLYAGGFFAMAGGNNVNNIARWDGNSWSALGLGIGSFPSYVYALAVSGTDLYAGGYFTTAGGNPANYVAKWDGSGWSALGLGIGQADTPYVYALTVSGTDLYAGGNFGTAGDSSANSIAKWNGSSWAALGSGMGGIVFALAVSGSDLYAGGSFTTAGGIPATNIAKWDGSTWSALGSGINNGPDLGTVSALAVSGSDLYVGGRFRNAGGRAATYIAKWNGTSWSALGSGMNDQVRALAVLGSELCAGGNFTTAGGKVSAYVARAIVNPPVVAIEPDGFGGYFLRFSAVPGSDYRLQRAPVLSGPWATSSPQTAPASGFLEFWDVFPPPGQGFYRSAGQ